MVLAELVADGGDADPRPSPRRKGFEAMDTWRLDAAVDEAIAGNPPVWERYRAGEDKVVGALVGQVMKATKDQADGKAVTAALRAAAAPDPCLVPPRGGRDLRHFRYETVAFQYSTRRTVLETTLSRIER